MFLMCNHWNIATYYLPWKCTFSFDLTYIFIYYYKETGKWNNYMSISVQGEITSSSSIFRNLIHLILLYINLYLLWMIISAIFCLDSTVIKFIHKKYKRHHIEHILTKGYYSRIKISVKNSFERHVKSFKML